MTPPAPLPPTAPGRQPRPRGRAAALVVLLAAPALVACGGERAGSAAPEQAAAADGFPVVVEHTYGETEVPARPERVVTVGFNEEDFALALGTTPVGVREYLGYDAAQRPWAQELLPAEPAPTLGAAEIDVEAVAALEPDLILGVYSFMDQQTYDLLSAVAPTVAESADHPLGGTPWQEQTLMTGRALGVEEEAEQLVADVEAQSAEAAAANPAFDGAVLPVDFVLDDVHTLLTPDDLRMRFFTDLGFEPPAETGPVSPELLDSALDGEALVLMGGTPEELLSGPVLGGLPVVTEGRAVALGGYDSDFAAALGFSSPLSIPYALDVAVPRLAAAVDGDPATAVEPYEG